MIDTKYHTPGEITVGLEGQWWHFDLLENPSNVIR